MALDFSWIRTRHQLTTKSIVEGMYISKNGAFLCPGPREKLSVAPFSLSQFHSNSKLKNQKTAFTIARYLDIIYSENLPVGPLIPKGRMTVV